MGTGGPYPGAKAQPGCDADHSLPPSASMACSGTALAFLAAAATTAAAIIILLPSPPSLSAVPHYALSSHCQ
jgi:hypothetical protein